MASGPRMRRASETGASSWPTWTPSAPDLECEVGPVVEHEGHPVLPAHRRRHTGPRQQGPRFEVLVAQLDHVDPAGDARREELGQVGAVRRAEVEAAAGEVPGAHASACAWAFMAFLVARTLSRLLGSRMSATERKVPSPP